MLDVTNAPLSLDLWGGQHLFYPKDKEYRIIRDSGLFSNICVSMYGSMKWFNTLGTPPEKITFNLLEYFAENLDVYSKLFKLSDQPIQLTDLSEERLEKFFRYFEPNALGIGRNKWHFDWDIINRLLEKYYVVSDEVKHIFNQIQANHNIDFENTVFIWARKTDKVWETKIPSAKAYKDVLEKHNLMSKRILLQTDDLTVVKDFQTEQVCIETLEEIPYADPNLAFHQRLGQRLTSEQFVSKYGLGKIDYLQRLIALMLIASKCNTCILYPGSLSTIIPIFRGSFDNCYSFIDDTNLFT